MASGLIGNEVHRKVLRVRLPCPPLVECCDVFLGLKSTETIYGCSRDFRQHMDVWMEQGSNIDDKNLIFTLFSDNTTLVAPDGAKNLPYSLILSYASNWCLT